MGINNYIIKFSPKAENDLDSIYRYVSEELFAENAATDLLERIEANIMRLKDFPFSCNLVEDEFLKKKGYSKLIIDNYIAFYLVDDVNNHVIIMRILYGSRKYQNLL